MTLNTFARRLAAACLSGAMLAGAAVPAVAQDKPIRWELAGYYGMGTPPTKLLMDFAADVKEATDGRLQIMVRPVGELPYTPAEYHRVVGNGSIDMADSAWITADVSSAGALTLPLLVRNFSELRTAMKAAMPGITSELQRFGAKPLFWYSFPVANFWGTGKPPASLADFSGRKIRGLTPEHAELIGMLHAAPATIATPEVMTALQYGTINTAITSAFGLSSAKWDSVIKWGYIADLAPTPSYVLVNQRAYDELPEAMREKLDEVAARHQEKMLDFIEQEEVRLQAQLQDKGMTIVRAKPEEIESLAKRIEPVWQAWPERRGDAAKATLSAVRESLGR